MVPVNLIGITGHAQNGKTTCAERLIEMGWHRVPFASILKEMLGVMCVPHANLYGSEKEEALEMLCGKSARYAMQTLGTELGRTLIGQEIWVNSWKARVGPMLQTGTMVVVDDVRFPNEVEVIQDMGGFIIRVIRSDSSHDVHESEVQIDSLEYDHTITNFKGVEELRQKISCFGKGV